MFQVSVFRCSRLKFEENNYKSTTTMEEIKIKREAYVKRIKELEQEASAASSDEEAMIEVAVVGQQYDVLRLAFLGRVKG